VIHGSSMSSSGEPLTLELRCSACHEARQAVSSAVTAWPVASRGWSVAFRHTWRTVRHAETGVLRTFRKKFVQPGNWKSGAATGGLVGQLQVARAGSPVWVCGIRRGAAQTTLCPVLFLTFDCQNGQIAPSPPRQLNGNDSAR
jgi:hypothetical protein